MAKRKTEFELITAEEGKQIESGYIHINGSSPDFIYVTVVLPDVNTHYIKDDDLETFALNILKSLKSKHLKQ